MHAFKIKAISAGLFFPFIIVFVYSTNIYSGLVISKNLFLLITIALILCCFSFRFIFIRQVNMSFSFFDGLFALFMFYISISAHDMALKMIPLFLLSYYFLMTAVGQNTQKSSLLYHYALFIIVIMAAFESLIGLLQNYSIDLTGLAYYYKISGTFGTPTLFIAMITPAIPTALTVYYLNDKPFYKNFSLIGLALIIMVLPLTLNRASWLAAAIGTAVFFILKNHEIIKTWINNNLIKKIGLIIAPVVILLTFITALYFIRPTSADSRLLIWRISYNMFKDNPITGIGFGNYSHKYMDYQADFFKDDSHVEKYSMIAGNVNHAHNEFIQLLVETGIIGLSLFLAILFYMYYHSLSLLFSHKLKKEDALILNGALSSISAILVIAFFGFYFYFPYISIYFIVYLALISHILRKNKIKSHTIILNKPLRIIFAFVTLFLLFQTSKTAYTEISSRKNWQEALTLAMYKQPQLAIEKYKIIYTSQKNNGEFLYMFGATYITIDSLKKGLALLEKSLLNYNNPKIYIALGNGYEKSGQYKRAIKNYKTAGYMMPHEFYPHYLLAKIYYKIKKYNMALDEAELIINKPVKIKSPAIIQIKDKMEQLRNKIQKRTYK